MLSMRKFHRMDRILRGTDGLKTAYGLTDEEASLYWAMTYGAGHEDWIQRKGRSLEEFVAIYNSTMRKMHPSLSEEERGYAYLDSGKVHFTDK